MIWNKKTPTKLTLSHLSNKPVTPRVSQWYTPYGRKSTVRDVCTYCYIERHRERAHRLRCRYTADSSGPFRRSTSDEITIASSRAQSFCAALTAMYKSSPRRNGTRMRGGDRSRSPRAECRQEREGTVYYCIIVYGKIILYIYIYIHVYCHIVYGQGNPF